MISISGLRSLFVPRANELISLFWISYNGVSGKKSSVFARAAFEVTVKHLLDAAIHGEYDPLEGITENVIVGQTIALGTGIVDLTMSSNYREYSDDKKK